VEATKHLTLIMSGVPTVSMKIVEAFPLGFSRPNKLIARGIQPTKLGKDTI
jgi:hypothetical protein